MKTFKEIMFECEVSHSNKMMALQYGFFGTSMAKSLDELSKYEEKMKPMVDLRIEELRAAINKGFSNG